MLATLPATTSQVQPVAASQLLEHSAASGLDRECWSKLLTRVTPFSIQIVFFTDMFGLYGDLTRDDIVRCRTVAPTEELTDPRLAVVEHDHVLTYFGAYGRWMLLMVPYQADAVATLSAELATTEPNTILPRLAVEPFAPSWYIVARDFTHQTLGVRSYGLRVDADLPLAEPWDETTSYKSTARILFANEQEARSIAERIRTPSPSVSDEGVPLVPVDATELLARGTLETDGQWLVYRGLLQYTDLSLLNTAWTFSSVVAR